MRTVCIMFVAAVGALSISGCASDGTKPDDMSAAEHRAAAKSERTEAEKHDRQYDPSATRSGDPTRGSGAVPGVDDVYWDTDAYNPTLSHQSEAESHRRLARAHEAAARSLEQFEEGECKAFPASTRPSCPLLGPVAAAEDIEGGVRLRLSEGFAVKPVADHVRCHFAFARTQGYEGMDACPLYLQGLRVEEGDGYIDLLLDDPAQLDELRRRARNHSAPGNG